MERPQHTLYFGMRALLFKITSFQDPAVKRVLSELQNFDRAAMPKEELREVRTSPQASRHMIPTPGWVGCLAGSRRGQEGGWQAGPERPLEEEGSRDWWEDALARPASPGWWS